ncbi:ankyrin [Imleria badia]|nr:ankyrin [Imleria badia]
MCKGRRFRWVQCQIDTLEKCSSVSEIRRVLESLPEGLEETYRRILIAIDRRLSDARLARRALVWLVGALRPMYMRELREAVMIDPEYRALDSRFGLMKGADLLDVCRSLVVYHEETDIITLSHMSVKEYLVGELVHAKLPTYHIVLEDAHEQLARLCMTYIAFCLEGMRECKSRSSILTREPDLGIAASYASRSLLKYVLSDGFNHLAHLGSSNARILKDIETLQRITRRYTWEWDRMRKLVPSIRTGVPWPTSEHDFMLYTLIAFASDALFETLVRRTGLTPREGTNPLVYVAHFGKTGHARALISQGADVNHPGLVVNDLDADNPDEDSVVVSLEVAVDRWNAEIADLLLAHGAIVPDRLLARVLGEQPHNFPLYIINRLLQTAEFSKWAINPWENRGLLEALVDDAEDHDQVDGRDEIALALRRLVEVGCAETLLLVAVEKECISVVEALLSMNTSSLDLCSESHSRAIVNALAANGDTPLHLAMKLSDENRCLIITKLLIEAGCSPCERDADDKPPVHIAVVRGFISVVEYLLSQDASLPSRILFAALQATLPKRVEMIRLLISKEANVHILSPDGDALLHVAMRSLDRSVCPEIAKILIDASCNASARNLNGETPLCIAAKQECPEIGNYLLLFGTSSDIWSILHPDPSSQATALRLLVGNVDGSRFLPQEEDRLLQAIRQFLDDEDKHLAVAKRLMVAPGDHSWDNTRMFDSVVRRGFCRVVEYLLSQRMSFPGKILFTALRHQVSMVPFLIRKGADLHFKEQGKTLLHVVMKTFEEAQCLTIMRVLVAAGFQPSTSNDDGQLPIEAAISGGFFSVVEYLLSQYMPVPREILSTELQHQASSPRIPLPGKIVFTALRDQTSMVPFLIGKGVDLDAKETNGDTLLHVAMSIPEKAQCLTTTQVLVRAGCDTSTANDAGQFPIDVGVSRGFDSVVEYLLSQLVPLPHRILFTALRQRQAWMVRFLIRKGADVHAKEEDGTLLHVAIGILEETRCLATMKDLVSAGCRPSISNDAGQLPIDVAVSRGFVSVVEYLLSRRMPLPRGILFTALRHQPSMVLFLIRKGADLHAKDKDGDTLLHVAISTLEEVQCCMTIQALVGAGCVTSTANDSGQLPIDVGVSRGFVSVVEYLLSQRIPLPHGILFTSLQYRASMLPFLLSKGANVHVQRNGGDTLLHAAMSISEESQCHMAVHALVQAGCPTSTSNAAGVRPIHVAVSRGFISVVKVLLSLAPHDRLPSDLLSTVSPRHNPSSTVRLLVDHGANVAYIDLAGNGLLHYVTQFSDEDECLEATRVLFDAGCRHFTPNASEETPLHAAVMRGFASVAVYLISNNVPLPPDILSPVLRSWPMYEGDPHKWKSMVTSFISKGANVHARETDGDTLIHHAMRLRPEKICLEVTELLVGARCSISVPNANGKLPVQMAVAMVMVFVVEYLLSHHAPCPPDILLTAVKAQHSSSQVPRMMSLLVRNGADVSVCATNGDSVLHVALTRERYWLTRGSLLEVVKILVQAGCDPCACDSRGHTPLEIAITMEYSEVEDYLRACVAEQQLSLDTPLRSPSPPILSGPSAPCSLPSPTFSTIH